MTLEQLQKILDSEEYNDFKRVTTKLSTCQDIHVMLLLHQLVPAKRNMVAAAEHDKIWFAVDVRKLLPVITEEQAVELSRCGVLYDSDSVSLCMFV